MNLTRKIALGLTIAGLAGIGVSFTGIYRLKSQIENQPPEFIAYETIRSNLNHGSFYDALQFSREHPTEWEGLQRTYDSNILMKASEPIDSILASQNDLIRKRSNLFLPALASFFGFVFGGFYLATTSRPSIKIDLDS